MKSGPNVPNPLRQRVKRAKQLPMRLFANFRLKLKDAALVPPYNRLLRAQKLNKLRRVRPSAALTLRKPFKLQPVRRQRNVMDVLKLQPKQVTLNTVR